MNLKKIKYSSILKWAFGGSLLGAVGLFSYVGDVWNNINADVKASISAQLLQTNDKRTIVVCISDEREEIDWSEVQIVPSFYNPTSYTVENLNISYEVNFNNISFEPTDFYVKNRYSKTKDIYNYRYKELQSGESVPTPFYSYSIIGNNAKCRVVSKEKHKGSELFEYQTQVYFIVVKNDSNISLTEWIKECRERMEEIITDRFCDAYFIDKNHHIKHDHSFALRTKVNNNGNPNASNINTVKEKETEFDAIGPKDSNVSLPQSANISNKKENSNVFIKILGDTFYFMWSVFFMLFLTFIVVIGMVNLFFIIVTVVFEIWVGNYNLKKTINDETNICLTKRKFDSIKSKDGIANAVYFSLLSIITLIWPLCLIILIKYC